MDIKIRLDDETLAAIDDVRRTSVPIPSRVAMIRELIEHGLLRVQLAQRKHERAAARRGE